MNFKIKNTTPLYPTDTKDFEIGWETIEQVYEGQLNCCACGCGGDYFYTQHYCDHRRQMDGNPFLKSSDEKITILLRKVEKSNNVGWMYCNTTNRYILEAKLKEYTESKQIIEQGIRVYFMTKPFELLIKNK